MGEHTKYQMEYIESVDGCAHQSAVDIIGALEQQCDELAEALEKIVEFGHGEGHGRGYTCANMAQRALDKYRQPQEEAPELFPGTLDALRDLGKQEAPPSPAEPRGGE